MPRSNQVPREFCIHALIHITDGQAGPSHPQTGKTPATRKKSDGKLDFLKGRSGSEDRRQDPYTQLALSRLQVDVGSWKKITVTLALEGDVAALTVHGEDGSVLHSVPIHTLKQTSIRHAHRSLFFRPHVLALYPPSSSQQSPIFLDLSDRETLHAWLALLRAYAQPEVYGRNLVASAPTSSSAANAIANDGGLYRMWRQFDVVILDGRLNTDALGSPLKATDPDPDHLFVELFVDGVPLARTTAQRTHHGSSGPVWHESLAIPDLPPAQRAVIRLSRIRRGMTFALGELPLELAALPRGAWEERRCGVQPLDDPRPGASPIAELRLRLRMDEEIVLPQVAYSGLLDSVAARNFLEWQRDLDIRLGPAAAALRPQLIAVVSARRLLIEHMIDGATREVEGVPLSANPNVLFRSNTVFTKAMEAVLYRSGASFLESSIGPIVRRICAEKLVIETDPTRAGQLRQIDVKEVDRNAALLAHTVSEVWDAIYGARSEVPQEIRRLLQHLRLLVEQRPPGSSTQENAWQGVSAFFFLRFVVPAILRPHSFGLVPGLPDPAVSRTLTLIGKVIQGLANLNTTVDRAEYMRPVKDFLLGHMQSMIDFLIEVSTPLPAPSSFAPAGSSDNSGIAAAVKARQSSLPALLRDAVPRLPELTDLSRHLALISSAIVRHAKSESMSNNGPPTSRGSAEGSPPRAALKPTPLLDGLVAKCQEVEARALRRVSRLATHGLPTPRERSRSTTRRPATSNGTPSRPSSAGVGATRDSVYVSKEREPLRTPLTPIVDIPGSPAILSAIPTGPPEPDVSARTRKISTPIIRRPRRPSTAPTFSPGEVPPVPFSPLTTPPRGILVNNSSAANKVTVPTPSAAPPLLLPILLKATSSPQTPQRSPQQPVMFTQPFSPQMDVRVNSSYSPSVEKGNWSRTSAPTLIIPDGLSRPKPFTTLQGIASTDSLHVRTRSMDPEYATKSGGTGIFRVISRDQGASPEEPRKKRRNILKVLIGKS